MLSLDEKISILENYLNKIKDNYAESFKTDIAFYLGDFNNDNNNFIFLNKLSSKVEIENCVDKLTSRIVLKFDKENEQLSDFIYDYFKLG